MAKDDILIVEDHAAVRSALADTLRHAFPDLRVREAKDYAGAVAALRAERPRVALVDIELGDGNGLELVARLHAEDPGVAVVMVSQHPEALHGERARAAGAAAFVAKDRLHADLLPAIEHALGREDRHGA